MEMKQSGFKSEASKNIRNSRQKSIFAYCSTSDFLENNEQSNILKSLFKSYA